MHFKIEEGRNRKRVGDVRYWVPVTFVACPPELSEYQIKQLISQYGDQARTYFISDWDRDKNHWRITFFRPEDAMEFYLTHHEAVDAVAK